MVVAHEIMFTDYETVKLGKISFEVMKVKFIDFEVRN